MNKLHAAAAALAIAGGALTGLAGSALLAPHAHADVYAQEVGDDNGDGVVMEDESGWDCSTMGNQVCGGYTMILDGQMYTHAIALSDLPNIDMLPKCATETGEGTSSLPCIWNSTDDNSYLTYPEYSLLIVDNTTH